MTTYASLAMYPFDPLGPAWEALWAGVHARLPWTPARTVWRGDVGAHWRDPACTVAHACGWPVAADLPDVIVVGAFALALDDADGHRYRSVVLGRPGASGGRLAANGDDSLSGWISALAAGVEHDTVTFTGSHVASLEALAAGTAEVACIDALTLAHVAAQRPALVEGLVELGRGPWIPSPPIVVPATTAPARVEELRGAFAAALPEVGTTLRYTGFVPLDRDEYEPVLDLVPGRPARRS